MTKAELISLIAEKGTYKTKKEAENALEAVVGSIKSAIMDGEKVSIVGFGTFEVKEKAAHEGFNPNTKKKQMFPAKKSPVFKAGTAFKNEVNNK